VNAPAAEAQAPPVRRIAVIVPMLNEAAHVEHLVDDIAAQDFEGEVSIFVADGGSEDGSPAKLRRAAEQTGLDLTLLQNPRRRAAPGLNVCLEEALRIDPDLIVRLDCHSHYPSDYFRRCAEVSQETGAWNVGGLFRPIGSSESERAIACALESPFGGHNWMPNRDRRSEVDTVFCGAFRPFVFERAGPYDEEVGTAEVEELNIRIRKAGGKVVYDPSIWLEYAPRPSLRALFVQYYRYGLNKMAVAVKHRQVVSGRSVVPLVFVGSLALLGAGSLRAPLARRLLAAELAVYGACALGFGVLAVRGRGESWSLLPRVVACFPIFHAAHGLGSARGWLRAARKPAT
jgi:glycosyltransferase involved in cell wall biosynthesis